MEHRGPRPDQARAADDLLAPQRRFAAGGLLHYGQGKWYPGEPLPRWAFGPLARRRRAGLDRRRAVRRRGRRTTATAADAGRLHPRAGRAARPRPRGLMPGLRGRLVLPLEGAPAARQRRPAEAASSRRGGARAPGPGVRAGARPARRLVLPLQRATGSAAARLGERTWYLRGGTVPDPRRFADGLPPAARHAPLGSAKRSPARARSARPGRRCRRARHRALARRGARALPGMRAVPTARRLAKRRRGSAEPPRPPAPGESAAWLVRTALCVEPRDGLLHVFLPPLATLEDYLDLVAAVEATAAALDSPVVLEGYPPPHDPGSTSSSHARPGVIEVNVHPTALLGRAGRADRRRSTRKPASRGSAPRNSCSTAATPAPAAATTSSSAAPRPADSPFLRRPDLLRALLGYWHNHPSLSFLFSGLFIGPTSQRPRVDEARNDRSTSWRSPSADSRARRLRRPGWSTGSSATCWST